MIQNPQNNLQSIWKLKSEVERNRHKDIYDTITETGEVMNDPEKTKEYIADYFEELYQARPAKPENQKQSETIIREVKQIEKIQENQAPIEDFEMQELTKSIKKLKRRKAQGPDEIPNEIFIEADETTKLIYLEAMNKINKKMHARHMAKV